MENDEDRCSVCSYTIAAHRQQDPAMRSKFVCDRVFGGMKPLPGREAVPGESCYRAQPGTSAMVRVGAPVIYFPKKAR